MSASKTPKRSHLSPIYTTLELIGGHDGSGRKVVDLEVHGGARITKTIRAGEIRTIDGIFEGNLFVLDRITTDNAIIDEVCATNIKSETGTITILDSDSIMVDTLTSGNADMTIYNVENVIEYPVKAEGTLIYNKASEALYISNGNVWKVIDTNVALPKSLENIVNLNTLGNDMLYTTAPDTYAFTPLTPLGRLLLQQTTINSMQSTINVTPGINVQSQSETLTSISETAPHTGGDILYATGAATWAPTPSQPFGRSILNTANSDGARGLIGGITGPVSTPDHIITVGPTADSIQETGIAVDAFDNITGVASLTMTGGDLVIGNGNMSIIGTIDGITAAEREQIRNIDTATISTSQWSYLSTMDQIVSTGSTPTFNGASMNSQPISSVANPSGPQDAATKNYVDSVATTGAPPLISASCATASALPDAPVYASPAETLTSSAGAGTALTIDGITMILGDEGKRVVVKDQANAQQNGVYTLTSYGGGGSPWQLTRSSDFNQGAMPLLSGTTVFIELGIGTQNGSSWSLESTINDIDPLTDDVIFVQIGAILSLSAGSGIDSVKLVSGTIETDISARLKYSGTSLDLNTVPTAYGGSGVPVTAGQTSRVVITDGTDGTNPMDFSKVAPTGDFVGDIDSQVLTNKTITSSTNVVRATQLSTTGVDVVVSGAAPPATGQALVATSATTAAWSTVNGSGSSYERVLTVAQSGGQYVSISAALADIGVGVAVATSTNPITIQLAPGSYNVPSTIAIPQFVTIEGMSMQRGAIIVPTTTGNRPVFSVCSNSGLANLEIFNANGLSDIVGVVSSFGAGKAATIDRIFVRGCDIGFESIGSGTSYTSLVILQECGVASELGMVTNVGIRATNGGTCIAHDTSIIGTFATNIVRGIEASGTSETNRGAVILYDLDMSYAATCLYAGNYGEVRSSGGVLRLFSTAGIYMLSNANTYSQNLFINDDEATYPFQIHIVTSGVGILRGTGIFMRSDKVIIHPLTQMSGTVLNLRPGLNQINFIGELAVGYPGRGFSSAFGEGDSHVLGMVALQYDSVGTSYNDISPLIYLTDGNSVPLYINNVPGDIFYFGENGVTGPDIPFYGAKITIPAAQGILPFGGKSNGNDDPPQYSIVWEYWDGSAWRAFPIMVSGEGDSETQGRNMFNVGEYQVNFPHIYDRRAIVSTSFGNFVPNGSTVPASSTSWFNPGTLQPYGNWSKTIVNGINGWWVRARQTGVLTQVPSIDEIKLHTHRTEILTNGSLKFYGAARHEKKIAQLNDFIRHGSNSYNPNHATLFTSNQLSFRNESISFVGNNVRRITAVIEISDGIDTSEMLSLRWRWHPTDNVAANVEWTVYWGYTRDYDNNIGTVNNNLVFNSLAASPSIGGNERSISMLTSTPGVAFAQVTSLCRLDGADVLPGDLLWVTLERGGDTDPYESIVNVINITLSAVFHTVGEFI